MTPHEYRRDLDVRAERFALNRRIEAFERSGMRMNPERKYGLEGDDLAYLAALDAAFRDDGRDAKPFHGFGQAVPQFRSH